MAQGVNLKKGFTIVELIVIIIVIAILVTIVSIGYSTVTNNAKKETLRSDARTIVTQINEYKTKQGSYPNSLDDLKDKPTAKSSFVYTYSASSGLFCVTATLGIYTMHIVKGSLEPQDGACVVADTAGPTMTDGAAIQAITAANCPTTRTRAVDARDNHTYWVQKLADGRCWMLTNLAYGGGGTDTYGDVKTVADGTATSTATYTVARYYIVPSSTSYTTEPTAPSVSTAGTGQYGYIYNWCAAMGNQTSTSSCMNATTPAPNATISLCPAGWRLPTGGSGSEFAALNTAINSGSATTDTGLRTTLLAQRAGYWSDAFINQGSYGGYWSSTQVSATNAYLLSHAVNYADPAYSDSKRIAIAVRCTAQ